MLQLQVGTDTRLGVFCTRCILYIRLSS